MEGDEKVKATETLSSTPATGGWTCPQCGTENDGNFCFRCGGAKPEPAADDVAEANPAPVAEDVVEPAPEVEPAAEDATAAAPEPAAEDAAETAPEAEAPAANEAEAAPEVEAEAPTDEAQPTIPIAGGWTCLQCGTENDGNFCFRCGGAKPEPAAGLVTEPIPEPEAPAAGAAEQASEASVAAAATAPGTKSPAADATTLPELPDTPAAPKRKVKPWVWAIVAAVLLIGIGFGAFTLNQSKAYDEALEAYSSGNYSLAAEEFQKLGNYKDATSLYDKSTKWVEAQKAENAAENSPTVKSWRSAAEAYEAIDDDAAKQKIAWCNENVDYWTAMDMLDQKPTDRDTVTEALALFQKCKNIEYISARIDYCNDVLDYYKAGDLAAQGHYYDAYKMYDRIGIDAAAKLGDVEAKRDSCVQSTPGNGTVYHNDSYSDSCELTIVNEGNPNAYYKLYIGGDLVVTAFVNAGESATFMLPAGSYSMNKAYGDKWFGPDDMFGDEGSYFVCSFGGATTVELEANNGYEISSGGEGTGIGTRSTDRGSI